MRYNEQVALDLKLSLEDDYVLEKIEDMQNTFLVKEGNEGAFSFNLTDLFKRCPMVFKQIDMHELENRYSNEDIKETIRKTYETNKKKFQNMLKGGLGKAISRSDVKRTKQGKKESYFKFNKIIMTQLKNGYPTKIDREFTETEKLVMQELNINEISKSISSQLKEMDVELLKDALNVAKENGINDYPYVRRVYNNLVQSKKATSAANTNDSNLNKTSNFDITIVPQRNQNYNYKKQTISNNNSNYHNDYKKTKFHNFNENFTKYTTDELDEIIEKSQEAKFGKKISL